MAYIRVSRGVLLRQLRCLWMCLLAFSLACVVAGVCCGSCEDGAPNSLYVIFFIILLAMQFLPRPCVRRSLLRFADGLGCAEVQIFSPMVSR